MNLEISENGQHLDRAHLSWEREQTCIEFDGGWIESYYFTTRGILAEYYHAVIERQHNGT